MKTPSKQIFNRKYFIGIWDFCCCPSKRICCDPDACLPKAIFFTKASCKNKQNAARIAALLLFWRQAHQISFFQGKVESSNSKNPDTYGLEFKTFQVHKSPIKWMGYVSVRMQKVRKSKKNCSFINFILSNIPIHVHCTPLLFYNCLTYEYGVPYIFPKYHQLYIFSYFFMYYAYTGKSLTVFSAW